MTTRISANSKAELAAKSAQSQISNILVSVGIGVDLAERKAKEATQPLFDALKPPRKTPVEIFEENLEAEVENAQSYHDGVSIILRYTPGCIKYKLDLPFSYMFNYKRLQHAYINDFQYCCSALLSKRKRTEQYRKHFYGHNCLNGSFAPDVQASEFSDGFIKIINDQIDEAVYQQFLNIYMECLGPNGLNLSGKDYKFVLKTYGVDPLEVTDDK